MTKIESFHHDFGEQEIAAVAEVLSGPMLTTGETVNAFEREFADYLGVRRVVGLTSCTGGLHLSLLALGIEPGDEVITTPMTFIATATAILSAGETPRFIDFEQGTGNHDAALLGQMIGPKMKAVVPIHLYGAMCDMEKIREIADASGFAVIEDSAHCIEGIRDGVRPDPCPMQHALASMQPKA